MFSMHRWIRNLSRAGCCCGALFGSVLPAMAQFLPEKGVTTRHLKEPKETGILQRYYWLNDHEVVYVPQAADKDEQYYKLNLATEKKQALGELTKLVRDTGEAGSSLPEIFPSPDRKYLAWAGTSRRSGDTLVVATIENSILSRTPNKSDIYYPSWSADSQQCFYFLEGSVPDDHSAFPGFSRPVFNALVAVSIKTPVVVKTYPIALKPDKTPGALSGYTGFTLHPLEAPVMLPDFHFGSENNILLVSPKPAQISEDIQFDEYNLSDTTTPVLTHSMHLPALWEFEYAVISPKGDAIVWKFNQEPDDEFWISDQYGGNLKRLGKLHPSSLPRLLHPVGDYMKWLPSGKGFSFLDQDGLCVVYLGVSQVSK